MFVHFMPGDQRALDQKHSCKNLTNNISAQERKKPRECVCVSVREKRVSERETKRVRVRGREREKEKES